MIRVKSVKTKYMERVKQSEDYIQNVVHLSEEDVKRVDYFDRERYLKVTSNIRNIRGIDETASFDIYKKILACKARAFYDHVSFHDSCVKEANAFVQWKPKIYVTFHAGSHKMVGQFLQESISNLYLAEVNFSDSLQAGSQAYPSNRVRATDIEKPKNLTINLEDKDAFNQSIELARNGYSLLFYADESKEMKEEMCSGEKTSLVPLFQKNIRVGNSIAYLSHLLGMPIVPILSHYDLDFQSKFDVYEPIQPYVEKPQEQYMKHAINTLWRIFERYLDRYSDQWEGWMYINDYVTNKPEDEDDIIVNGEKLSFNDARYDIYFKNGHYLFDRYSVKSYAITSVLFRLIESLKLKGSVAGYADIKKDVPQVYLNQMIANNVLL